MYPIRLQRGWYVVMASWSHPMTQLTYTESTWFNGLLLTQPKSYWLILLLLTIVWSHSQSVRLNMTQLCIFSHVLENSINTGSRGSKSNRASFTPTTNLQLSLTFPHICSRIWRQNVIMKQQDETIQEKYPFWKHVVCSLLKKQAQTLKKNVVTP